MHAHCTFKFLLCSNGARGHSDNFMPIDLELEQRDGNYYTIVSAYPRRRANKHETLLVDTRPTNVSTVAATVPHERNINNENGVEASRDIVVSNVSSENIPQEERDSKPKYSLDASDNGNESFLQRIKNFISGRPRNQRIHKTMKRQLEDLSKMKIAAGHLPEGVQVKIDEIAKVIRTGREYDWLNILPAIGLMHALNMNEIYEEYMISSGAQGNFFSFDKNYEQETIEKLTKRVGKLICYG